MFDPRHLGLLQVLKSSQMFLQLEMQAAVTPFACSCADSRAPGTPVRSRGPTAGAGCCPANRAREGGTVCKASRDAAEGDGSGAGCYVDDLSAINWHVPDPVQNDPRELARESHRLQSTIKEAASEEEAVRRQDEERLAVGRQPERYAEKSAQRLALHREYLLRLEAWSQVGFEAPVLG
ncbi:unnamed protein product [Polarella glacialis]|uniref:Uncharacterized protein n=1 Tax=Polarella glacialis TaxID=89957 RepID=A0A813E411_POLGL|nr:unnamed protein product [Polarella glacialis]